ncbi:MAG: NAD(P)/FAD-dependent oxidoreductase [Deltaproteobacteria bacterium]|nr:NAD(P)/FAD-dependent oxidoreductase [Deltaproteobacteria bacterium]
MMDYEWDILVVGAGPAGTSAARVAAEQGVKVMVVESRRTVGMPVRCAEYLPRAFLGELPKVDRGFLVQYVKGMRTFLPDGTVKETMAPGFTIRRDLFDQTLAARAEEAGARICLETRAVSLVDQGSVLLKGPGGGPVVIKPRVIIGADGPGSTVGKWMGNVNRNLILALQCRVRLTRPMEFTEVYFHREIYGGYGWIFPKDGEANVGLGIVPGERRSMSLKTKLEWFVDNIRRKGTIKGRAYGITPGWIPVKPVRRAVKENMLLVGDAAAHTHPITGAGVPQAVMCGRLAGKWAARAVLEDDLELLKQYDHEWQEEFGETLTRGLERRRQLEAQWHHLCEVLPSCWVAFRGYYGRI